MSVSARKGTIEHYESEVPGVRAFTIIVGYQESGNEH